MGFIRGICSLLSWLLGLYSTVIVVKVILSWFLLFSRRSGWRSGYGGYGYNQGNPQEPSMLESVDSILGRITDPYLHLFDGLTSLRRGSVDFTPLAALVLISLARSILNMFAHASSITLWLVLAIIIEGIWTLVSFVMVIMLLLMVVRLIAGRGNSYQSSSLIDFIDPIIDGPVGKVYRMFFRKKGQVEDQKLVLYSLILYFILYLVLKAVESGIVNLLLNL